MPRQLLPKEAAEAVEAVRHADIVIGIPSYNNARTIGHVVRAAHAGLAKYFPQFTAVIVNSDGGSKDGTQDIVVSARMEDPRLLMLATPLKPVHSLSAPYDGIPGKGSAFRLVFQIANMLDAKACAVVDSDLRSITPEWIDMLVRPVLHAGYDFVAPYYHRHKYDGTITNSIVYPITRALYGKRIRQPIGGDFGLSGPLLARYLQHEDWETDVARFGIDIWMTTIAVAEGYRVCQSFLGAKLHDAKDPGSDLTAMLEQVVGSVFTLMSEYASAWSTRTGSEDVDLFGFRYDVGLDPIDVNLDRMLSAFRRGCEDLAEIWSIAFSPATLEDILRLSRTLDHPADFHLDDYLWTRIVYELASACHHRPMERRHLLQSLTPLYLARVGSFVIETRKMFAPEVEKRIEELCLCFEREKKTLIHRWMGSPSSGESPELRNAVPVPEWSREQHTEA